MPSFFLMIRRPPRSTLFPYTALPILCRPAAIFREADYRETGTGPSKKLVPVSLDRKSTRLNSSHGYISDAVFFFNDTATTEIYTLSLHGSSDLVPAGGHFPGSRLQGNWDRPIQEAGASFPRSEEHTSELQSRLHIGCRLFF